MKPWQAIFIGFVQVLSAVFPGTSRSMSTIAAGQVAGLSRAAALDFSFFVSVPVMIVATLYDLYKYERESGAISLDGHQMAVLGVGFVVSFLVAYVVIAWFLAYVKKRGFTPFGLYRIAVGIFLLWALG
jgi:undecaprenyl-diphosphatase